MQFDWNSKKISDGRTISFCNPEILNRPMIGVIESEVGGFGWWITGWRSPRGNEPTRESAQKAAEAKFLQIASGQNVG